jgi:hypothetical protein
MVAGASFLCVFILTFPAKVFNLAGAELFFDGTDDYLVAFPNFLPSGDWTIEAWLKPSQTGLDNNQCIFHLSTYSNANILTLEVQDRLWKLQYGDQELPGHYQGYASQIPISTDQVHVAITHNRTGNSSVPASEVVFYLNGSSVFSAPVQLPQVLDTQGPFMVGACLKQASNGLERMHFYSGHLDEIKSMRLCCKVVLLLAGQTI